MANNKSNKETPIRPLLFAMGIAVMGMLLMSNHLSAQKRAIRGEVDEVGVLVVEDSIEVGDELSLSMLGYKLVDREDQPWSTIKFEDPELGAEAMRRYEEAKSMLSGRVLNRTLEDGDMLLWTDLEEPRRERLSELFEGRRRAVSVEVDSASLMDGLLQPNDRVDVLATFPAGMLVQGGNTEAFEKTMVILEDVTVMAQGGRMTSSPTTGGTGRRSTTVVLALAPEEALLLSHVQKGATISLLLRPFVDEDAGRFSDTEREVSNPDLQETVVELMQRYQNSRTP